MRPTTNIPTATSVTHEHLLSVLNTETLRLPGERPFRVLDVGCGNGLLLGYVLSNLPRLNPSLRVEVHGLDVADHGVQPGDYFAATIDRLCAEHPDVKWTERLSLISVKDTWPYPNDFFDAIYSNQVLEHVGDYDLLFSETHRTLRTGGFAAHLFPLEHAVYEGHLLLPWVHRVRNHDVMVAYIRALSRLGLGKYPRFHRESGVDIDDFSERHADYMHYFTNYLTMDEALDLGKRHGLRTSFRYTEEFYTRKLASILRRAPRFEYRRNRSGLRDLLATQFYRYISCITLFLEKKETYTCPSLVRREE
jgi:SAM-dependent methyltransferase